MIPTSDLLIYLAGILWGLELVPQIYKTQNIKNVQGISLAFYLICYAAYIISTIGNILQHNLTMVISYLPSFIGLTWMIILIFKYRNQ
jgi:uncharacterized protein with PQ loop repeat